MIQKKQLIQICIILQSLFAVYLILNILFNFGDFFQSTRHNQNTIITFLFLVLFVELLIFIAYIFKEKAVKKILIICASSSAFIVILMVAFVASEGIPAFTENNPVDFITGTTFQIFYSGPSDSKKSLLTTIESENETIIETNHSLLPQYTIIQTSGIDSNLIYIDYLFNNPLNETINISISVEAPDYFSPSFDDIPWDYQTKTGYLTLNASENKTLTFQPRLVSKAQGIHLINITAEFTQTIRETAVIEFHYAAFSQITADEVEKKITKNKTATYNLHFEGKRFTTYQLILDDVQQTWQYELVQDNQTVATHLQPEYELVIQENKSVSLTLVVTPPDDAEIGSYDYINIIVKDPGTSPTFGILPFIVGTILTSLIAIVIAAPIGVGCAVLLSEYLPSKLRFILRSLFELLAGIPSVIYGLFGFITFGPLLGNTLWPFIANTLGGFIPFLSADAMMQKATFTAGIVLSIMILPIIITLSEDSIRSVSRGLREGSLALGTTKWQTVRRIVLPDAKSGVISGIILGLGRAIGETMAVLMIMQYVSTMPTSLLGPSGTMTGVIATMLGSMFSSDLARHALFGIALLLFLMIFMLNVIIFYITKERKHKQTRRTYSFFKGIIARTMVVLAIIPGQTKKKFTILNESPQNIEALKSQEKNFTILQKFNNSTHKTKPPATSYMSHAHHFIQPKTIERLMIVALSVGAGFALFMLIWILGDVLIKGLPSMQLIFFLENEIGTGVEGGFLNAIIGSLQLVALALLIAAPLSLGAAIYIEEYAKKNNIFTRIILFTSDTLASTPSIVYGGFGFLFFVVYLRFGFSVLSGGFTLGFMILPILLRSSIEAIKAIPREIYEGSLALGATKWQAIKTVILPPAQPGIISGVILGIGRSIGETAAVIFTAGYSAHIATSILHPAGSLPNMIYKYYNLGIRYPTLQDKIYSVAIVLIIVVLILNTVAKVSYMKSSKMMKV
jgi:phosphate transport system permease protein